MKERPILMSGPMVLAILDNRKEETRRAMKPQPSDEFMPMVGWYYPTLIDKRTDECYPGKERYGASDLEEEYPCPYGAPGDRLWVRETFCRCQNCGELNFAATVNGRKQVGKRVHGVCSACDRPLDFWRPSIFMRREESRLTLHIETIAAERLQDITERSAEREGIEEDPMAPFSHWLCADGTTTRSARAAYAILWDSINGAGEWASNPWVWVIKFWRVGR